jgi:dihydrofolate reductase
VDEVLIRVAPVLIGDGIRLFSQKAMEPVRLEKTVVSEAGQMTNMRFRFAGKGREFTKGYTKRRVL